jgi:hypothetical protein
VLPEKRLQGKETPGILFGSCRSSDFIFFADVGITSAAGKAGRTKKIFMRIFSDN